MGQKARRGPRAFSAAHTAVFVLTGALATGTAAEWEPAVTVDHEPAAPYGPTYYRNALTVGSNGLATALFFQKGPDTQTTGTVIGSPFALRRTAGAATWSAPAAIATPSAGQAASSSTDLTSKPDGSVLGLFGFTPSGGGQQSLATAWPADAVAPEAAMPMLCTADAAPICATNDRHVAFDTAGNAYAGGATGAANANLLFARTDPSTGTWLPVQVVQTGAAKPNLSVDPAGNVALVYVRNDPSANMGLGAIRLYGRRMPAAATDFEAEVLISGPNRVDSSSTPALVMDQDGTATVTFLEDTVPNTTSPLAPTLRAVRWPLGAAPMPGRTLSTTDQGQIFNPGVLALDPQNRVTAAWSAPKVGNEVGIVYIAQFDDAGGQWGAAQQVSPANSSSNFADPQLAADDAGTLTLIYSTTTALSAQRKAVGEPWSPPTTISRSGAGNVQSLSYHVASRKPGQADVTFVQTLDGVNRLFATRFNTDTTPDQFTFTDQADVPRNSVRTSNVITVTGIEMDATIEVVGGEYSIDGADFVAVPGTVGNGQTVAVRHTSASDFSTATDTVLTIGDVSDTFTSTTEAQDLQPDPFQFQDQLDVAQDATITSDAITVTGINAPATISVSGGSYNVNGGGFTTATGTVNNGDTVQARHTSAGTSNTTTNTTVTIGGVSDTFTSTTTPDTTPDAFTFTDQTGVPRNSVRTSNTITVTGIDVAVSIDVTGGTYSIDGGAFTSASGTVANGQTVAVQHTSSGSFSTATDTTLTIGGVSDTFTSTTPPPARRRGGGSLSLLDALLGLVAALGFGRVQSSIFQSAHIRGQTLRIPHILWRAC